MGGVLGLRGGAGLTLVRGVAGGGWDRHRVAAAAKQVGGGGGRRRAAARGGGRPRRRGAQDNRRYWSLLADAGATLVCFRARS
ncbi:hypothetical protein ACW23B_25590 [Streptomyces albidoflavus]